jgi:ABC-2 type transport system permease protein
MKSLLAIEWLKIKSYRTFWILIGLFVLLLPLWNYEVANGIIKMGGGPEGINFLNTAYDFPGVWANMGWWGSIFILFLAILVIILTTNEYTYRTHRQNVIDGWSRIQFFHAKVWLVLVLSLLATLYLFILGTIFGLINSGSLNGMFSEFQQVFYFFLLSTDYLGFALLIALWIRRSGLAISLFLLYSLIIENILKFFINWKIDLKVGNLLPLQASDELLPFPIMKLLHGMMPNTTEIPMNSYVIVTIIWCLIYYFAGRRMLLRSDW